MFVTLKKNKDLKRPCFKKINDVFLMVMDGMTKMTMLSMFVEGHLWKPSG